MVYPESQRGFRAKRSMIHMIVFLRRSRRNAEAVTLHNIHRPNKGLVSRGDLFKFIARNGCPLKLLSVIQLFHKGVRGIVLFDGSSSTPFSVKSGVKQECMLAPSSSASTSQSCQSMLSEHQLTEATSSLGQMANFTSCPD